jgi:hypothetical protein
MTKAQNPDGLDFPRLATALKKTGCEKIIPILPVTEAHFFAFTDLFFSYSVLHHFLPEFLTFLHPSVNILWIPC